MKIVVATVGICAVLILIYLSIVLMRGDKQ
jgi:hypothetical protein